MQIRSLLAFSSAKLLIYMEFIQIARVSRAEQTAT